MQPQTRELHPTRDLQKDWRQDDAEKLAVLENESDAVWPGGGGWQTNPREMERWLREGDHLAVFVTEDGNRIASICSLMAKPGQQEHSYIDHLLCHPDYHGRKYGKSVLHAAVEYAHQAGFRKVDLHTWSGNMKAVPLYKKAGFMWRPDTTVFMENFTPAARRHPLGAAYFARHDWYATLERTLDLKEDLVMRGKVHVYEYRWRADSGDFLRMVFDRQSWRLVEIENDHLLAACSLPDEKLVAGTPHPVEWRLVNKRPEPVRVFLSAGGDPGVDITRRETLELADAARIEGSFTIDPAIPEKTQDPTASLLNTDLIVDGAALELSAGITARQAVDISVEPARALIAAGRPQQAVLSLRSNLDRPAQVRLTVVPVHNARLSRRAHRVKLRARGGAELPVPVASVAPGPLVLEVQASAAVNRRKIPVKTKRLDLLAAAPGDLAAGVGEDQAMLCSGSLMVSASRRHGSIEVYHRLRGARAMRLRLHRPQFGPPFAWEDLFQEKAEAAVEEDGHKVAVRLRSRSVLHPGLVLDRRIGLDQGPLVEVVDTIVNGSARALDLQRLQPWWIRGRAGTRFRLCAPLRDGVHAYVSGTGGRTLSTIRLPQEGEKWPEGWLCRQEEDGCVTGAVWDRADIVEVGEGGHFGEVKQQAGRLRPGQTLTMKPFYGFVGDGTFQTVRSWWQQLFGPGLPQAETPPPSIHSPVELALEPRPLLVAGDQTQARLSLRSCGTYKLSGRIAVQCDGFLRADVKTVEVAELTVDRPLERTVPVRRTRKSAAGPAAISLAFETDEAVYRSRTSALLLPSRSKEVEVSQDGDLVTLSNGLLTARAAPGFFGSVVSLERRGREFLNSSFPEGGMRGWRNPWHGGIHPAYDRLWGRLHKEKFRFRLTRRKGAQGLVWQGVRLTCRIDQEEARGHVLHFDYLLARGADVLAVVAGCRDAVGVWSEGQVGFNIWSSLAPAPGSATFHTPHRAQVTGLAAPRWCENYAWKWGGLANRHGDALFLSCCGHGAQAGGWAEGPEGCVLYGSLEGPLPAGETIEALFFLVPASSLEEAEERAVWSEFAELP